MFHGLLKKIVSRPGTIKNKSTGVLMGVFIFFVTQPIFSTQLLSTPKQKGHKRTVEKIHLVMRFAK
jgi:hypothetical protein